MSNNKEGHKDVDRLFKYMVNYREFSYEEFIEVGSDKEHRWYFMLPEKFKKIFNKN
jgi:hypothetical protein